MANEPKWTPGPWRYEPHISDDGSELLGHQIWGGDGRDILYWDELGFQSTAKADAHLIAAAPTMAEFVRARALSGDEDAIKIWEQITNAAA